MRDGRDVVVIPGAFVPGVMVHGMDKLGSRRRGRRRDDRITLNSPSYKVGITFRGAQWMKMGIG